MGLLDTLADLRNHEFLQDGFGTTSNLELTDEEGRKHKHRIHAKINATNAEFLVDMAVKGQCITFIQGRYLITRITSHVYHSRIIAYSPTESSNLGYLCALLSDSRNDTNQFFGFISCFC